MKWVMKTEHLLLIRLNISFKAIDESVSSHTLSLRTTYSVKDVTKVHKANTKINALLNPFLILLYHNFDFYLNVNSYSIGML